MNLGFDCCFCVPCTGKSGGLILLWNKISDVSIDSFSSGHIDAVVKYQLGMWRFTGFYGNPIPSKRQASWELLRRLS